MEHPQWLDLLGWGKEELDDIRFIGYSYLKQGHYDTAIAFFEALTVLSLEEPYDFQTLGALYLQKGNNLAALNFLEKALKMDPFHGPTLLNRTKALFGLGYRRQAFMQAQELLKNKDAQIVSQVTALLLAYGSKV